FVYDNLNKRNKRNYVVYIGIAFLASLSALMVSKDFQNEVLYLIIGRNFEQSGFDVETVLNERAGKESLPEYQRFAKTDELFIGKGPEVLEEMGVLSDIRGFIFSFGLITLIFSV